MRTKAILAASLFALTGLATNGVAAAPSCDLVKDPKGDVDNEIYGPAAFPADEGLDVIGGDIATNAKNVTAVIKLAAAPGLATAYAKRYIVQFKPAGTVNPPVLAVAITPTGTTYSWGYYGPTTTGTGYTYPGTASGSVNGTTLTITAPLADMSAHESIGAIKKGAKVGGLTVTSFRRVPSYTGAPGSVFEADAAAGKSTYVIGAKSCVVVPA